MPHKTPGRERQPGTGDSLVCTGIPYWPIHSPVCRWHHEEKLPPAVHSGSVSLAWWSALPCPPAGLMPIIPTTWEKGTIKTETGQAMELILPPITMKHEKLQHRSLTCSFGKETTCCMPHTHLSGLSVCEVKLGWCGIGCCMQGNQFPYEPTQMLRPSLEAWFWGYQPLEGRQVAHKIKPFSELTPNLWGLLPVQMAHTMVTLGKLSEESSYGFQQFQCT